MRKPVALLCRRVRYHTRTDTQHDYSQGNCRTIRCSTILFVKSRIHTKLVWNLLFFCVKFFKPFEYSLCIFFILLYKFSIIIKNLIEFNTYSFYLFLLINRSCWGGEGAIWHPAPVVFSYTWLQKYTQMYAPTLYKVQMPRFLCSVLQYTPSVRYYLHTLFWYRHTYMTFPPPGINMKNKQYQCIYIYIKHMLKYKCWGSGHLLLSLLQ